MRKHAPGTKLQITTIVNTVGGRGSRPKLWGFHRKQHAAPSLCKITAYSAEGAATRVVK